jgi:hypothetical protein
MRLMMSGMIFILRSLTVVLVMCRVIALAWFPGRGRKGHTTEAPGREGECGYQNHKATNPKPHASSLAETRFICLGPQNEDQLVGALITLLRREWRSR